METGEIQTEEELLLAVACYGSSEDAKQRRQGEEAFVALMERHQAAVNRYVGASVKKYSTFRFNHEEMYFRVWEKIWKSAGSFEPKTDDPQLVQGRFLSWASKIREIVFNDAVSAIRVSLDFQDFQALQDLLPEEAEDLSARSPRVALLKRALSTLSDRDQDILRSLAESTPLDGTPLRTSSEDLRALADQLGVTVPSLTTMRKRAIERLKEAMEHLAAAK